MYKITLLCLCLSLWGCSTNLLKINESAIHQAEASGQAVFIYSKPRRGGIGFVNTSDHPIARIELKLVGCGTKGEQSDQTTPPFWYQQEYVGPFAPRQAYLVTPTKVLVINARGAPVQNWQSGFWYAKIVRATVYFTDNTPHAKVSDMHKLLSSRLSNYCFVGDRIINPWIPNTN